MWRATVSLSKWTEHTLSPVAETQQRAIGKPCYCVCCSFMRESSYTLTHIIGPPVRTEGSHRERWDTRPLSSVTGQLADTVATTSFMWLPRSMLNHHHCTSWQAVITGAPYCVSMLKMIKVRGSFNVHRQSISCRHWKAHIDITWSCVAVFLCGGCWKQVN